MQLCGEGKLKNGIVALCIQCDLQRGYSLLIQDAPGFWNERLSIHWPMTMKQKENERKKLERRTAQKVQAQQSVRHFYKTVTGCEIVQNILEWSLKWMSNWELETCQLS